MPLKQAQKQIPVTFLATDASHRKCFRLAPYARVPTNDQQAFPMQNHAMENTPAAAAIRSASEKTWSSSLCGSGYRGLSAIRHV
jgi:hypothetical protein